MKTKVVDYRIFEPLSLSPSLIRIRWHLDIKHNELTAETDELLSFVHEKILPALDAALRPLLADAGKEET